MHVTVEGVTYNLRSEEAGFEIWRGHDDVHVGDFTIGEDGTITYQGWFTQEVSARTLIRIAETCRTALDTSYCGE